MPTPSRSPWLPLSFVVFGCLMYSVAAQSFAPPINQRHDLASAAVKVEDVVNITGAFPTGSGQVQLPLYQVPMTKRLILTSVRLDGWNWGDNIDLVEDNAGVVTRKVPGTFILSHQSSTTQSNAELEFPYPLGLRFEPGSFVALRRYNDGAWPAGETVPVVLVGALVDAY